MKPPRKSQPTTRITHDTRRSLKNGNYPVKLSVTYQRTTRHYGTNIALSEEDYAMVNVDKAKKEYKKIKHDLVAIEERAMEIIAGMMSFSWDEFMTQYYAKPVDKRDVFESYKARIAELAELGNIGTASNYTCAMNSIRTFHKSEHLFFINVSVQFLKHYEKWMVDKGKELTTVSMYLRTLRTLYNQAIKDGIFPSEHYPFGADKYVIPEPRNTKKALPNPDMNRLYYYFNNPPEPGSSEQRYFDLWFFSYLCNGINMKDIALLRFSDIDSDTITFRRAKTVRTARRAISIQATLLDDMKEIINRWGNKKNAPDSFVFTIIKSGQSAMTQRKKIQQATKQVNKYVQRVARNCGIDKHVTSYTARHSFGTMMLRLGADPETIREAYGHGKLSTTQAYLSSIDEAGKRILAEQLTDFNIGKKRGD